MSLEAGRGPAYSARMRFFFHIADKYGVSTDGIGCEYAEQDAAVLHASRLAAELAKAGEFFRGSVVLVARATGSLSRSASEESAAALLRKG
ncbi:DUF6894 family protein [Bradyrhizobium sacchari]|uniref:DUF6894 domain-containing protein n=1 Tax=Bradyrhizobium sacchari TaxID=1399419 RepID=A0A560IQF6_9BRAD|nr:hypothetical protein [Bradyrhizobium sacchari]TWB58880.1 hypothetical protein FBZ94_105156 [Bradyrhizobium sacchari]TWB72760.1 hypothetical protein FBZ95_106475 [Bradyrhizobium sacchari]